MKNKRIILVANSTWNIYNFRLNVVRKLLDEGNEVTVVAPLDEYIEYKEKFPSVKHIPLKNLNRESSNPFKDLQLILELQRIYKSEKPDLVVHYTHKPNIFGGIAAKLMKIDSVAVVTGLGYPFINKGWINGMTRRLYKLVKGYHKQIIFENQDDLNLFIDKKLVDKNQGVSVNGCGVDSAIYLPYPSNGTKNKSVFTFIGRLLYDKGIVEFIEAAKIIKEKNSNTEFWVVGELDNENPSMLAKSKLLEWIDEGYILYHGFLKDVRPVIAKSDCIVLPSYREGMPRIILEGMSMAKPVITSDTAGCRQTVVNGENGYLVKIKDVNDLVSKINMVLEASEEQRNKMGTNGRKMVLEKFKSEIISNRLYEILAQV